jgi:hypothetical protein
LIVSSSNWHLSFSKGEGPSSACVSEMVWHLQRIACLPAETLETNEYNFSQVESVKCEPLYNLQKMPASMPLVASGCARVGHINAEREKGAIPPMRPLRQKKGLDSEAVDAAVEGAVAALKEREFVTIHSALNTCCESEHSPHQPSVAIPTPLFTKLSFHGVCVCVVCVYKRFCFPACGPSGKNVIMLFPRTKTQASFPYISFCSLVRGGCFIFSDLPHRS